MCENAVVWRRRRAGWINRSIMLAVASVSTPLWAVDTWDNSTGNANWSNASNWADNTLPLITDAVTFPVGFPGGDTLVTFAFPEFAQSLTINDSYSFDLGTLTLGGTGNVTVASTKTVGLGVSLSGSGGFTKLGAGTLDVTAGQNISGGVFINAGTLAITANTHLGNSSNSVTLNDGTLAVNAGLSTSRSFVLGASGGTLEANSSLILSSTVSGSGSLTKTGVSSVLLSGANNFIGAINVNAGGLRVNADSGWGDASNAITVNGGTLGTNNTITTSRSVTIGASGASFDPVIGTTLTLNSPLIGGAGPLSFFAQGTLALGAASTRTGPTDIGQNIVRLNNGAALGTGQITMTTAGLLELSAVTCNQPMQTFFNSGMRARVGSSTYSGTITRTTSTPHVFEILTVAANDTLTIGDAANDYTGGDANSLARTGGPGTVIFPFSNNYAGNWEINSGTLRIQNSNALGSGTSPIDIDGGALELDGVGFSRAITMNNGATLRGVGVVSTNAITTVTAGASVSLATGTSVSDQLTVGSSTNQFTGGSGATVNVSGAGTVRMLASSNYAGGWQVNGGTLRVLIGTSSLGTAASAVGVQNGTLQLDGIPFSRAIALNNASTLRSNGSVTTTTEPVTVGAGATVTFATTGATDNFSIGDSANDLTGGSGATAIAAGPGTVYLTNASNYIGAWQVSGGKLSVQNNTGLGTGTSAVVVNSGAELNLNVVTVDRAITLNNGATLRGTGPNTSNGTHTVASNAAVTLATGPLTTNTLAIGNAANDLTGGGVLSSISVSGSGRVILQQSSNYTGMWLINSGTLELANDNALGNLSNTVTINGGTLSTTGTTTSARTIYLPSVGTITNASATTLTASGLISGAGTLTKLGAGTLETTGASNSVATVNVDAGTLLESAGTFTITDLSIGSAAATNGRFNLTGGSLNVTTERIGDAAVGTFVQSGGTHTITSSANPLRIAEDAGSTGVYTLQAGSLIVNNNTIGSNGEAVGFNGTGSFVQTGGTHNVTGANGNLVVGYGPTGVGTYTISNGGLLQTHSLYIGRDSGAVGTMSQFGGTVNVDTEFLDLGLQPGASGTYNMMGGAFSSLGIYVGGISSAARGTGVLNVSSGTMTTTGTAKVWNTAGSSITLSGGTLSVGTFESDSNPSRLTWTGGTLEFTNSNPTIGTGSALGMSRGLIHGMTLRITGNSNYVRELPTGTLAIAGGKVDLTDNKFITSQPIGTHDGTNYTGITGLVEMGRNAGFWNGAGITTSMSNATNGSNYTMLGVASASEALGIPAAGTGLFAGATVTGTDTLVMYTYGGDANLSGFVDIDDYGQIDFNASTGGSLTGWFNGDFDYNGIQDIDDYGIIDFVVNIQGPPFATTSGMSITSVPEPSAACGLAVFFSALASRRRRR